MMDKETILNQIKNIETVRDNASITFQRAIGALEALNAQLVYLQQTEDQNTGVVDDNQKKDD